MIVFVLCCCMMVPALAADYTFTDRDGVTRAVPDGEYSFVTRVVEFIAGDPWTSREDAQDPNDVLGLPDRTEGRDDNALTLGAGGVLVVEFNINIMDGEGDDLYIFEVGDQVEATKIEVSSDLATWYAVGTAEGKTAGLDLKGKVPEGSAFRYVRLTDLKEYPSGTWPGADIDAIAGLNVKPVTSGGAGNEVDKAFEYGLVPDILEHAVLSEPITRLEFAAVSVKVYENLAGTKAIPATVNPFTDCNDAEMLKAYNLGVAVGTSETTFEPGSLLNREQAATMLTRVFKRATIPGWSIDKDSQFPLSYTKPAAFADDQHISGWAKDSVYFMNANGIILGVEHNNFAPKNITTDEEARGYADATREQALSIAVRMVETLK